MAKVRPLIKRTMTLDPSTLANALREQPGDAGSSPASYKGNSSARQNTGPFVYTLANALRREHGIEAMPASAPSDEELPQPRDAKGNVRM